MPFALKIGASLADEPRRIAVEQIDRALAEIEDTSLPPETAVHQVRKRGKKLRGLLRLVREPLGDAFRVEDHWYRDTGRLLGALRDAYQSDRTLARLLGATGLAPGTSDESAAAWRDDAREVLSACYQRLAQGRQRAAHWTIDETGFEMVRDGLAETYRQGRERMCIARQDPTADHFHAWRKSVKYHGYHLKLLRPVWPAPLRAGYHEVQRLGEYLGDDHDLAVLALKLGSAEFVPAVKDSGRLQVRLEGEQQRLRHQALGLGERIYAEKTADFTRRMKRYWRATALD